MKSNVKQTNTDSADSSSCVCVTELIDAEMTSSLFCGKTSEISIDDEVLKYCCTRTHLTSGLEEMTQY